MKEPITIGIVDDDLLFAEALELLIAGNQRLRVLFCVHDRDGLFAALAGQELPDVLLLDLKLKNDSGLDVVKELHAAHAGAKVIALSAFHKPIYVGTAFRNGFSAFLAKHTGSAELFAAIEQVHATGIYFRASDMEQLREFLSAPADSPGFLANSLLSARETEVLQLICRQYANTEIAEKLFISVRTVEGHRNRILEKTGLRNTAGLVIFAITSNLIDVADLTLRNDLKS